MAQADTSTAIWHMQTQVRLSIYQNYYIFAKVRLLLYIQKVRLSVYQSFYLSVWTRRKRSGREKKNTKGVGEKNYYISIFQSFYLSVCLSGCLSTHTHTHTHTCVCVCAPHPPAHKNDYKTEVRKITIEVGEKNYSILHFQYTHTTNTHKRTHALYTLCLYVHAKTHTYTHTHTRTRTHTHTNTCVMTRHFCLLISYVCVQPVCVFMCVCAPPTHLHTHWWHRQKETHLHVHTHMHARTHTYTHTHTSVTILTIASFSEVGEKEVGEEKKKPLWPYWL